MLPRRSSLPLSTTAGVLLCSLLLGGCRPSDEQLTVVQAMALALGSRKPGALSAVCGLVVKEQQNEMGCDNVLMPLLHYAPGFIGGSITPRGSVRGGRFGRPAVVPVHYQGKAGSGNLDVTMTRSDGHWRVFSLLPVP
jgi:hypothetical protein